MFVEDSLKERRGRHRDLEAPRTESRGVARNIAGGGLMLLSYYNSVPFIPFYISYVVPALESYTACTCGFV